MENLHAEERVFDLLKKMKEAGGDYPADMLAARRRTYLKQMANVGLGIGGGAAAAAGSKILEVLLVAAVALEVGTAAFLYRDKIADAVRTRLSGLSPQEVSSPAGEELSSTNLTVTEVIAETAVSATATPAWTPSLIPSGIPSTTTAYSDNQAGNDQDNNTGSNIGNGNATNASVDMNATPDPGGNNGNHYGQTPKPDRNIENNGGGGVDNAGGGGNNNGGGGGNNGGGGGKNNRP
jgi:hypothetical protein